jgi:hypothetical protein
MVVMPTYVFMPRHHPGVKINATVIAIAIRIKREYSDERSTPPASSGLRVAATRSAKGESMAGEFFEN